MVKLVERQRVKDACNIGRADAQWDTLLDGMIEQAGYDVERICLRHFKYQQRVEYHTSYDMYSYEVSPNYVFVEAPPIDTTQEVLIKWAPYNDHVTYGVKLDASQFQIPPDYITHTGEDEPFVNDGARMGPSNMGNPGVIVIRGINNITMNVPVYNTQTFPFIRFAERGWEVTYFGGYQYVPNTIPPDPLPQPDPLDDWNVVAVPPGLRNLIAYKIATDFLSSISTVPAKGTLTFPRGNRQRVEQVPVGFLRPWTDQEKERLAPWRRRHILTSI